MVALFHRYGPEGHLACGGHVLPTLLTELQRRGIKTHYYGFRSETTDSALRSRLSHCRLIPLTFHRASTWDKLLKTVLWYLMLPAMCLHARGRGIRVVFVDESLPLAPLVFGLFFGRGAVLTVADFLLRVYAERHTWLRSVDALTLRLDAIGWRRAGAIIAKTRTAAAFLTTRQGVEAERVHTVYNAVDVERFKPMDRQQARLRFGLPSDAFVLVHHGILHPNKGNERLIKAVAVLKSEMPNLRLLLVGSGPDEARLKALVRELNVDEHVRFTGWLPSEEDVNTALNAADVGLVMRIGQTSDHFHVTDTLTHEMAAGLPIVAARLDGIAEILSDNSRGLLFAPDDAVALQAAIKSLHADPARRARLAETSRAIAEDLFSVHRIGARLAAVIAERATGESSEPVEALPSPAPLDTEPSGPRARVAIVVPFRRWNDEALECVTHCGRLDTASLDVDLWLLPDAQTAGELDPELRALNLPFPVQVRPTGCVNPATKRNVAIRASAASILAFIDADAFPRPDWLARAVPELRGDIAVVTGPNLTPERDPIARQLTGRVMESPLGFGAGYIRHVPVARQYVSEMPTCNMVVRRIEGLFFREAMDTAEDMAYCADAAERGLRILYTPEIVVYHHRRPLGPAFFRQFFHYGLDKGRLFADGHPATHLWQAAPAIFSAYLLALPAALASGLTPLALALWLTPAVAYLVATLTQGGRRRSWREIPLLPAAFVLAHLAYGSGFVRGWFERRISRRGEGGTATTERGNS